MNHYFKWLITASIINLLGNCLGTIVAFQQRLPAELGSIPNSQSMLQDFIGFKGTALSAPFPFLLIQLVLILLTLCPGLPGRIGVGGLTFTGLFFIMAQAGEPIVMRQFSSGGFDLMQFIVLLVNIVSSIGMLVFGIRAWRASRAPKLVGGSDMGETL